MSGGAGTRLWPLSTEDHPKQFHALMGPRTMFADTVARVSGRVGEIEFAPPIVLCGEKHLSRVRDALAETSAKASAIVIEPAARNTAAVAASAAAIAQELDRDALVLLIPSDHVISDVAAFREALATAARLARERIVTFGVNPTYAATGYGYIKRGGALDGGAFVIEAFKEKPDDLSAASYLRDGRYSWNSGMFLFSPQTLLAEFGASATIRDQALTSLANGQRDGDVIRLGVEYANAPALPLDIAVMEHTARGAVVPCSIGWADIGSWAEVWRLAPRDTDGMAVIGPAASADTAKMLASGVPAAAIDGADLVVIAAERGLLIVPRALDRNVLKRAAQELWPANGAYEVALIGGAGDERAVFTQNETKGRCFLRCTYRGKVVTSDALDFFDALCRIRLQLEAEDLRPRCYGASLNVYPSDMARDMGRGLTAYKLTSGQQGRTADLVDIFDDGPDVVPSSVEDQAQFYQDWLVSLRA